VEAVVCANDITAANIMRTLDLLDIRTPQSVRIVGVDDVKYASLLRVPLTNTPPTLRIYRGGSRARPWRANREPRPACPRHSLPKQARRPRVLRSAIGQRKIPQLPPVNSSA